MEISGWHRFFAWAFNWWGWFEYPDVAVLPPKPWHPDGDVSWTRAPQGRLSNSDRIIAHMKRHGELRIGTGDVTPATWDRSGTIGGYPLNRARATDPVYVIGETVTDGAFGSWPLGATVRYHPRMLKQGDPNQNYSDNKVHVFDDVDGVATITEIQNFRGVVNGVIVCDGCGQYPLNQASTSSGVRGRSAAKRPLAELTLTYDMLRDGWVQRTSMGTPMGSSRVVFPPAVDTDAGANAWHRETGATGHLDVDAVPFGAVLRLKPEASERVRVASGRAAEDRRLLDGALACFELGVEVVDTARHHTFGVQPDKRFNQREMGVLGQLTLDDFEVWRD